VENVNYALIFSHWGKSLQVTNGNIKKFSLLLKYKKKKQVVREIIVLYNNRKIYGKIVKKGGN